ncbi:hypothetical protein PGT21_012578 [Puccinia graminis f. sp. tritici]|uniref:Uncharacterized protein n=1 Tax=Puccinia graminis f. sp. tritici TaxID=56615 RepID=A0A5B0NY87_PUCGR|nr:hypothetical protein PGT21_012578 [Puccinia graminis f. sp. tritici]
MQYFLFHEMNLSLPPNRKWLPDEQCPGGWKSAKRIKENEKQAKPSQANGSSPDQANIRVASHVSASAN